MSPDLISRVTDSVKEMLDEWRSRSLESFYPALFLDAIRSNIRESGQIIKKAPLALAIRTDGQKELLGMWIEKIYLSASEELAAAALDEFSQKWDKKYPAISRSWKSRWSEVVPFLKFSPEIRKAVYTTNAIESLNYSIRKITKNRSSFPNDDSAMKLIFMGLQNISKRWTMPLRDWTAAINQFVIIYGDRFPA